MNVNTTIKQRERDRGGGRTKVSYSHFLIFIHRLPLLICVCLLLLVTATYGFDDNVPSHLKRNVYSSPRVPFFSHLSNIILVLLLFDCHKGEVGAGTDDRNDSGGDNNRWL